jgi:hypothetical protein
LNEPLARQRKRELPDLGAGRAAGAQEQGSRNEGQQAPHRQCLDEPEIAP